MLRSTLSWVATAAMLLIVPVGGAGQCPCRVLKVLGLDATCSTVPTFAIPNAAASFCTHDHEPMISTSNEQPPVSPACPGCPCEHDPTPDLVCNLTDKAGMGDRTVDCLSNALGLSASAMGGAKFTHRVPPRIPDTVLFRRLLELRFSHSFRT